MLVGVSVIAPGAPTVLVAVNVTDSAPVVAVSVFAPVTNKHLPL